MQRYLLGLFRHGATQNHSWQGQQIKQKRVIPLRVVMTKVMYGESTQIAGLLYSPALPALSSGSSSHPMDVLGRLVRRVELDDPVHGGDVEATGGDVRAEQYSRVLQRTFQCETNDDCILNRTNSSTVSIQ